MPDQPHRIGRRSLAKQRGLTLFELGVTLAVMAVLASVVISNLGTVAVSIEPTATQASLVEIRDGFLRYWQDVKHTPRMRDAIQQSQVDPNVLLGFIQPRLLIENPDLDFDGVGDFYPAFDPVSRIGWQGPYFANVPTLYRYTHENNSALDFNFTDDPSFLPGYATDSDPYGRPDDLAIRDQFRSSDQRPLGRPIVVQALAVWSGAQLSHIDVRVVSAGENGELEIPRADASGNLFLNRDLESPEHADLRGDDLYVAFSVRP